MSGSWRVGEERNALAYTDVMLMQVVQRSPVLQKM